MGFGGGHHLFLVLFADSIIFVVFILKPNIIDASICVSCSSPPPRRHFISACVLFACLLGESKYEEMSGLRRYDG